MGKEKKGKDSEIISYKIAMPEHSNPSPSRGHSSTVNGGAILNLIDNICGIAALRHCRTRVVTASMDAMEFLHPVRVGELIIIKASVNWVGRTSMEVGCRVEVENFNTAERKQVGRAYLTFVAVNEEGIPFAAPKIIPETDIEIRRFKQAQKRRELRIEQRKKLQEKYGIEI